MKHYHVELYYEDVVDAVDAGHAILNVVEAIGRDLQLLQLGEWIVRIWDEEEL